MNLRLIAALSLLLASPFAAVAQTPPTVTTPPNPTTISVNPSQVVRVLDARAYGVNLTMWDTNLTTAKTNSILSSLKFGTLRFPGGSLSDEYYWQTGLTPVHDGQANYTYQWPGNVGVFAKLVEAHNASPYVTVNYGSGTPEMAAALVAYLNGSPSDSTVIGKDARVYDWQTVGYWATIRASAPLATDDGFNFLRISHPTPFRFTYFEVGNEIYGASWEYDIHGTDPALPGAKNDPYTYAQNFKLFKTAMLAVDPTIKIGAVAENGEDAFREPSGAHPVTNPRTHVSHTGWTPVMLSTMSSIGVAPDYLIFHFYPENPPNENDNVLLQQDTALSSAATDLRQQLTDYLGTSAPGVELVITEINSDSSNPGKQSANLVEALYYADAYGTIANTEFKGAIWWALHNGVNTTGNNSASLYGWRMFGAYDLVATTGFPGIADFTPLPAYYASKLLTNYWANGGDSIIKTTSNYDWLAAYGAKLANGKIALLVINKNPSADVSAQISLVGVSSSSNATIYSWGKVNDATAADNPDLTVTTMSNVAANFSYTFPQYSMTVIQLDSTPSAPAITAQPQNTYASIGGTATFTVNASGTTPVTYQWYKDGSAIGNSNSATLTISNVQQSDFGTYTVSITNTLGTTTSSGATLSLSTAYLANVSMRATVGNGNPDPIVGVVVGGSTPVPILVRGSGPALLPFGVTNFLPDPIVQVYNAAGAQIALNDNHDATVDAQMPSFQVGYTFTAGSKDAALVPSLVPPAGYTAHLTTTSGGGVGLVEMYTNTPGSLVNISANAKVGTGQDVLIAGFVILGTGNMKLLIRASGPALVPFGVNGILADPKLEVHTTVNNADTILASNDNWDADPTNAAAVNAAAAIAKPGFTQAAGGKDSAVVVTLTPGAYTVVVSGVNNGTGVALAEVYLVQ